MFNEFIETGGAHVRQIDVSDLASGGRVNFLPVGHDHVEFAETGLVIDGLHLHIVRSIFRGFGIDSECHGFIRRIHE